MNQVRTIEQQLADIDSQLAELYKKKDDLNKELKIIQEHKLQQEVERWKLKEGTCYWMFDKDNDSVYSTLYGYQIVKIRDDQFFTMIQTKYSIESGDPHFDVHEVTCSLHALRTHREENNVYVVDPVHYKEVQIRLLSLDIDTLDSLQEVENELVKPRALYQVE